MEDMSDAAALIAHARDTRVVVVGGGVAGLVAARECAKVGMQVTILEAADALGGAVTGIEVDGVRVDAGADRFTGSGPVRELIEELQLQGRIVAARPGARWVSGLPSGAAPLPRASLLGIPANPWAEDARRFIGWRGAWRAYLDRLRPPLTIGHRQSLGELVRSRMGDRVRDRMVAPATSGIFGITPDEVDVAAVAPGLGAALTRTGSLAGAVGQLLPGNESPWLSLDGGMSALVDALAEHLEELGATVRTAVRATSVAATAGAWQVRTAGAADAAGGESSADGIVPADLLIIATGERTARELLAPVVELPVQTSSTPVEAITLLVEAPELDAPPRGPEVVPVPGTATARSVEHLTVTWEWLADALGAGRHLVRVVLPSSSTSGLDDAAAISLAAAEAGTLLGVPLPEERVRFAHRLRAELAPPASVIGHGDRAHLIGAAVDPHPGLVVTGAWISGSGLARVVEDARRRAERVRRQALWAGRVHDSED